MPRFAANDCKFTGKERDSESGLDDFDARFYSSSFGRFMTPDWAAAPTNVPYANFGNPQSLNLYSYVQNNPTTMGDPDGHVCDVCDKVEEWARQDPGLKINENQPVPTDEIEKLIYLRVSCSCGLVSRDLFSDTDSRSGLVPDPSGLVRSRRTGTDAKTGYGWSAKGLMRSLFSPYAVFILTLCGLHSHLMGPHSHLMRSPTAAAVGERIS
jgi:RHS repeat-associated protein